MPNLEIGPAGNSAGRRNVSPPLPSNSGITGSPSRDREASSSIGTPPGATGAAARKGRSAKPPEHRPNAPSVTGSKPSLPEPLRRLTTDYYRPTHNVIELGPYPPRGWLPPPRLPPQVAAAIPSAIAALEQSLVPAEHNQIIVMLTELAAVLRLEDAANWELRFRVYAEDLADVPPDILTDACRQWRRQEKFWPVASELIALTDPPLKRRQAVLDRLLTLQRVAECPAPDGMVTREWLKRIAA